jgi:hypothetical protein
MRWRSFNAREDLLHGLTVRATVDIARPGVREPVPMVVTELLPHGPFATRHAERAISDHDRNTLRLRLDPQGDPIGVEPGITVWISRRGLSRSGRAVRARQDHRPKQGFCEVESCSMRARAMTA